MKIYSLDGEVIFEYRVSSLKKCIEIAVAMGIDLHFSDFRGAHLAGLNIHHAKLKGSSFKGAILSNAKLLACDLMFCNFNYITAQGSSFNNSNLTGSTLQHAAFHSSSFFMTELTESTFSYSNLYRCKGVRQNFYGDKIEFGDGVANNTLRFFDYDSPSRKIKPVTYEDGFTIKLDFSG